MRLSNRILRAINEGVSTALMLDDTELNTIIGKSSELISKDAKKGAEKVVYSKILLDLIGKSNLNASTIQTAIEYYEKYGAQYDPRECMYFAGKYPLHEFLLKVLTEMGHDVNLNWLDVSKILDFQRAFLNISTFNCDITKWDMSNAINTSYMFCGCEHFNEDLSNWNTANLYSATSMFQGCKDFEGKGLSNWDVSNLVNASLMFYKCYKFLEDLYSWDVSNLINSSAMFYDCISLNCDLSRWNVSKLRPAYAMFKNCTNFNCDLRRWKFNPYTDTTDMFKYSGMKSSNMPNN